MSCGGQGAWLPFHTSLERVASCPPAVPAKLPDSFSPPASQRRDASPARTSRMFFCELKDTSRRLVTASRRGKVSSCGHKKPVILLLFDFSSPCLKTEQCQQDTTTVGKPPTFRLSPVRSLNDCMMYVSHDSNGLEWPGHAHTHRS